MKYYEEIVQIMSDGQPRTPADVSNVLGIEDIPQRTRITHNMRKLCKQNYLIKIDVVISETHPTREPLYIKGEAMS